MRLNLIGAAFLFCFFLSSKTALARPEYATQQKLNCVACHATPWGGGPRNVFGKTYGSHGHTPAKTSVYDLFYADVRFIGYYPTKKTSQRVNGLALMESAVTGNVPILQDPEKNTELRGVLTYNIAGLSGAQVREAYLRWQRPGEPAATPTHVLVGQFYVPFGLLTDEHRTYTRIQTNTLINNYDVGGAIVHNFNEDFHGDFALVSDFQSGGNFTTGDFGFGTVGNLRWNPKQLPFLVGLSGIFQRTLNVPQPIGGSVYGVLSLDRLTDGKQSGSLSLERVDAKNWNNPAVNTGQINPGLPDFFGTRSDAAYQNSINQAHSVGYYLLAKYNLTQIWTPFYKFDYLDLDLASAANDRYLRHGFGVEAYLLSNVILNARYELSHVMRGTIADGRALAAQSDVFAMLRVWL